MLISIARGSGNPCQSPAGHLITTVAPSSLNPYHHLPSYVLILCSTSLTLPQRHKHARDTPPLYCSKDLRLIILEMCMSWNAVAVFHLISLFFMALRPGAVVKVLVIFPSLQYLAAARAPSHMASLTLIAILAHGHDSHFDISAVSMHPCPALIG